MTAYKQTLKSITLITENELSVPVAKLPIREMVTKVVPGKKYLCTDTGVYSEGKEGEALITRMYPDGTKDTYKNKKGPKYEFEDGKTWDDLKPGESAFGKLKDGPEYDRVALLASPKDTVNAVWDETQKVLRKNAYITVIYMNNKFDMSEKGKWGSKQIVLNNNAGDLHPIDTKRRDSKGNPVVIGKLPLTAKVQARKKELKEYVNKYYSGTTPAHLKPLEKTLNVAITHSLNRGKKKAASIQKASGIDAKRILSQVRQK